MYGKLIKNPDKYMQEAIEKHNMQRQSDLLSKYYELENYSNFITTITHILLCLSNACLDLFDYNSNFQTCLRALPEATCNVLNDMQLYEEFKRLGLEHLDSPLFLNSNRKNIVFLRDWIIAYNTFIDEIVKLCKCPSCLPLKIQPKELSKEILENPTKHVESDKGDGNIKVTYKLSATKRPYTSWGFLKVKTAEYKLSLEIKNPHYYKIKKIIVSHKFPRLKEHLIPYTKRYKDVAETRFYLSYWLHDIKRNFSLKIVYKYDRKTTYVTSYTLDDYDSVEED